MNSNDVLHSLFKQRTKDINMYACLSKSFSIMNSQYKQLLSTLQLHYITSRIPVLRSMFPISVTRHNVLAYVALVLFR